MKKIMIALFCVFIAMNSYGMDKKIVGFVGKYDVSNEAKNVPEASPTEFWRAAIDGNERFSKFQRNMEKNRGAEKEALKKWKELPRFYPQYNGAVMQSRQAYCDSLLNVMGIGGLGLDCGLYVIDLDVPDVYTMLTDDGFAICVTKGLLSMKGVDDQVAMGFVAHEFVHGAYRHYLQKLYDDARARRKGNLLGVMVAVGTIGAVSAAEAVLPSDGRVGDTCCYVNSDTSAGDTPSVPLKHVFGFSKDQVLEADLVAFRFLENMGCEEAYLRGLKILSPVYESRTTEDGDVAPIMTRINFIEYMERYPGLGLK